MPFPLLAAAEVGKGLISAISAASQRRRANQLIANNPFPYQSIPQGVLDATKQAEIDANVGMPAEEYLKGQQDIDRNTNAALRAGLDRHTGVSNIGAIQDAANNASLKLNVASANQRIANKIRLLNQKNNLGEWQGKVWDWNSRQKYLQNAAAARALLGASQQGLYNTLDSGLSGALLYANDNSGMLGGDKGGVSKDEYDADWQKQYDNLHKDDWQFTRPSWLMNPQNRNIHG